MLAGPAGRRRRMPSDSHGPDAADSGGARGRDRAIPLNDRPPFGLNLTILPIVTPRPVTRNIAQVLLIERAGGDFAAVRHLVAGSRAAGVRDRRRRRRDLEHRTCARADPPRAHGFRARRPHHRRGDSCDRAHDDAFSGDHLIELAPHVRIDREPIVADEYLVGGRRGDWRVGERKVRLRGLAGRPHDKVPSRPNCADSDGHGSFPSPRIETEFGFRVLSDLM
jgi:hypothetical protein